MSGLSADEVRQQYAVSDASVLDKLRENWFGYLLIFPVFAAFSILFYFPILRGIWISFTNATLGSTSAQFVGITNYQWMLTNDLFVYSLGWTLVFVFGSLFLQLALGLGVALLLNELTRGWKEWAGAILMSPYFSAPLVSGVIWMWFLNPNYGVVARVFLVLGMNPIYFLNEGLWPHVAMIVSQSWHDYAYAGIIYVAALTNVPSEQYEAAAMSGAGRLRRFRDVTVPHLLTPTIVILAIRTTWNIAEFAQPFELTAGGPGTSTMLLSILTYRTAYVNYNFGRAYAIGMTMVLISVVAAVVYIVGIQEEEELHV
jgi:ABC-type sugar transport system permease subunit